MTEFLPLTYSILPFSFNSIHSGFSVYCFFFLRFFGPTVLLRFPLFRADHCAGCSVGVGIITFPTAAARTLAIRKSTIEPRDQSRRHLIATAVIKDCTVTDNVQMPRSRARAHFSGTPEGNGGGILEGEGAGIMSRFKLMSIILFKVG